MIKKSYLSSIWLNSKTLQDTPVLLTQQVNFVKLTTLIWFSSVWVLIYLQHQQISYHSSCTDMVYLQCVSLDDLCKPYSGRMYCHRKCMNMVFPTRETSYSLKDHHYEESLVTTASWIWFLSRVFSYDLYKP